MDKLTLKNRLYDLTAKIIVYPGGGDVPNIWKPKIIERRIRAGINDPKRERATDTEVFFYLMSASLCFPLDHDSFTAIAYISHKDLPEIAKAGDMPEVNIDNELQVKSLIDRLARDIYRSQMKEIQPFIQLITERAGN